MMKSSELNPSRKGAHETVLMRDAREEREFRLRSEQRPKFKSDLAEIPAGELSPKPGWTDREPYWAWQMFDSNVPLATFHACTSAVNSLAPAKDL